MAAENTYDPGLVFDDATLQPEKSAVGYLYDVAPGDGGTIQNVYDMNGNPLASNALSTNPYGYCARFRADAVNLDGVVSFGSVLQPVQSKEQQRSGPQAIASAAAAVAAQGSALAAQNSAASSAASAAASAAAATAPTNSAIDTHLGGDATGLTTRVTANETALAAKADLVSGKVPASQSTPPSYRGTVATQAAMLALSTAIKGDWVIRSDLSASFILNAAAYGTLSNWIQLPGGSGGGTYATAIAGTTFTLMKTSGVWPARPSTRVDLFFIWKGPTPDPAIVTSGTGGMYQDIDMRFTTP